MKIDELNQEQVDLMISAVLKQAAFLQASCPKEHDKYVEFGPKLDRINENINKLVTLGLLIELHGEDVSEGVENARSMFRGFNFRAFSVTPNALLLFQELQPSEEELEGMPPKKRYKN